MPVYSIHLLARRRLKVCKPETFSNGTPPTDLHYRLFEDSHLISHSDCCISLHEHDDGVLEPQLVCISIAGVSRICRLEWRCGLG